MYDDYRELRYGAAKELEGYLNSTVEQRPVPQQSERIESANKVESGHSASTGEHHKSRVCDMSSGSSQAYDPRTNLNQVGFTTIQCDPESRWLLVCAQARKRPTSLSQIDVCSVASDRELFTQLRRSYYSLKGKWSRLLSLRTIKGISFVQVRVILRRPIQLVEYVHG